MAHCYSTGFEASKYVIVNSGAPFPDNNKFFDIYDLFLQYFQYFSSIRSAPGLQQNVNIYNRK